MYIAVYIYVCMREHHRYDARKNIMVTEKLFLFLLCNMKKAVYSNSNAPRIRTRYIVSSRS